jgi:molecular chaperone GrpE
MAVKLILEKTLRLLHRSRKIATMSDVPKEITDSTVPDGAAKTAAAPDSASAPAAAPLPPAQLEELLAKAAKADENWDRFVRQAAEFDNFKKRVARERQDAAKYAHATLLEKLVPVLDNLDMALQAAQNGTDPATQSLRTGIAMVFNQFKAALAEVGLEEIDAAGKPFDPNWHEAVSQQESAEVQEGHVLQQLRKGYKLRDRLLRPATVVVAKKPTA